MVTPYYKQKKKKEPIPICLHKILSNRDAQTDFRTVQESEFIGRCDLTQSTVTPTLMTIRGGGKKIIPTVLTMARLLYMQSV
jgi:hypothetical protein